MQFAISQSLGLITSILFAFWMNVRFNFKVPVAKRNKSLLYFASISVASALLNAVFRSQLTEYNWSYEQGRFTASALLFSFGYYLHRRFSFVDRKQVGVAVYANGLEDINNIRRKIGDFPDFIHVDLIDSSFGACDADVRSYRLEAIQAHWPRHKIHVHLMTRRPGRWLEEVLQFSDSVIIHYEIEEEHSLILGRIRQSGRQAGLCLMSTTSVHLVEPFLQQIEILMLLSIPQPGRSGQPFQIETLDRIRVINSWQNRQNFAVCIDGGVSEQNIHLLNVELVVSGSSVLGAGNPARQIMRLQTSNNYEAL